MPKVTPINVESNPESGTTPIHSDAYPTWRTQCIYFLDFLSGVRLPIVSEHPPEVINKWAQQLKAFTIEGQLVSGKTLKQVSVLGPVIAPDPAEFNPSPIIIPGK